MIEVFVCQYEEDTLKAFLYFQEIHYEDTLVSGFQPKIKMMICIRAIVQLCFMELGGILIVTARI